MPTVARTGPHIAALDLNHPGGYLHWSVFQVSVANVVVIAVMIAIFGAALLLPFPLGRTLPPVAQAPAGRPDAAKPPGAEADAEAAEDARMWTSRVRRLAVRLLPPEKLLPDRQPAYVASWVYVFGVATLAALGSTVASGCAIAIGGTDWWHTNPIGHFLNSAHLWSVQLFMAFMVIHLWGKFWMAAWRGRRAMTWITGVVAFAASVTECFTGYLSQQNFDSQWIATNGKDAFNGGGIGAFFNVMNFGQMLLWHVVLLPAALAAIAGAHIVMVRIRGVSQPLPPKPISWRDRRALRAAAAAEARPWHGPTRRYDILKEGTIAAGVVACLVVLLASLASSPDVPAVTVRSWATLAPADFLGTTAAELAGTSQSATYGPPYNHGSAMVQQVGPVSGQRLAGLTQHFDPGQSFVLDPLATLVPTDGRLAAALGQYQAAVPATRLAWARAYSQAVGKVTFVNGSPVVPAAADGPVPAMMAAELRMARTGALDADLLGQRAFYGTDFTRPLLFIADGGYYSNVARSMHLTGAQWGVMNETGSYPGQPWLWVYTLWYHVPPFGSSPNADVWAIGLTGLGTTLLLAIPFIPGLRDIPRLIPVHRLIWRPSVTGPGPYLPGPAGHEPYTEDATSVTG